MTINMSPEQIRDNIIKHAFGLGKVIKGETSPTIQLLSPEIEEALGKRMAVNVSKAWRRMADLCGRAYPTGPEKPTRKVLPEPATPVVKAPPPPQPHALDHAKLAKSIRGMAATATIEQITTQHNISRRTLNRICNDYAIQLTFGRNKQIMERERMAEIARRMQARGASVKEICNELGRSERSVRGYLNEADT